MIEIKIDDKDVKDLLSCSPNPYEEGTERIPHTKWSVSFFP